ncbi:hypothetical protein ACJ41O_001783 [Fusarium nematophilum]
MTRPSRDGLIWEESGLGPKPRWKTVPRLEAVKAVCLDALELRSEEDFTVEFFASGSFNRLYLVEVPSSQQKLLMRVSLPVDPHNKTMGEVATMQWLRRFTGVPVPDVIAFDASCDNEIGFEWILISFIAGASLYSQWRKLPITTKEALVKQVADFQAQILRASEDKSPLRGIGTLTYASGCSAEDSIPEPGQIVSRHFFAGNHFSYDIPRGPFSSSSDFLESYISIIIQDLKTELETTEDEDDREEIEVQLGTAERLMTLLPMVFPPAKDIPEHTAPWHDDLSLQNILVNDDGVITAVLDWEFVSAMPRWITAEMPQFLVGPERAEEPVRDDYGDETEEDAEEYRKRVEDGEHFQDNEGKNELYWFHRMEYEQTRLRGVYTERMRESRPTWDAEVADGVLKDDFLGAVERCAAGFPLRAIGRWIDAVERGESPRLNDVLQRKA